MWQPEFNILADCAIPVTGDSVPLAEAVRIMLRYISPEIQDATPAIRVFLVALARQVGGDVLYINTKPTRALRDHQIRRSRATGTGVASLSKSYRLSQRRLFEITR